MAGERWHVVSRAITDRFAELDTGSFGLIAVAAVVMCFGAPLLDQQANRELFEEGVAHALAELTDARSGPSTEELAALELARETEEVILKGFEKAGLR